jgi:hypothetical protein
MSDFTNPYDAVISDMEAKYAELGAAIALMKRLRDSLGGAPIAASPTGGLVTTGGVVDLESIPSDAFFGLTIVDAAIKFLHMAAKKPQSTNAIIEGFERGALKGKNYSTVYGVLNRRAKTDGDIVNVHGDWALAEWYGPKRRGVSSVPRSAMQDRVSNNPDTFVEESETQGEAIEKAEQMKS